MTLLLIERCLRSFNVLSGRDIDFSINVTVIKFENKNRFEWHIFIHHSFFSLHVKHMRLCALNEIPKINDRHKVLPSFPSFNKKLFVLRFNCYIHYCKRFDNTESSRIQPIKKIKKTEKSDAPSLIIKYMHSQSFGKCLFMLSI